MMALQFLGGIAILAILIPIAFALANDRERRVMLWVGGLVIVPLLILNLLAFALIDLNSIQGGRNEFMERPNTHNFSHSRR